MKKWKEYYISDLKRYGDKKPSKEISKFLKLFRKCQYSNNVINKYLFRQAKKKMLIDVYGKTKIAEGLYLGHPFLITINPDVMIGKNCNIHKGVTIGQENRGKRKGVPTIGNRVWIGINSTIVGRVVVGDDVLIAPNTFVNCDIPSHSIVFGNPCIIKHKDNATRGYINNPID